MDKYLKTIVAIVVTLFLICLCLFWSEREPWHSFGEHGLVETVALFVTIVGIDTLQRRREDLRMMPRRLAAHEDVAGLVEDIVQFWSTAYLSSVPDPFPRTISDLISEAVIRGKIGQHLWMGSDAPVFPARKWWDWLPGYLTQSKNRAEDVLSRNGGVLEPVVFASLHRLIRSFGNTNVSYALRQSGAEIGVSNPEILANFMALPGEYYSSVLELLAWCNSEAATLEKATNVAVHRIDLNIQPTPTATPLQSRIDPELLVQQVLLRHQEVEALRVRNAQVPSG